MLSSSPKSLWLRQPPRSGCAARMETSAGQPFPERPLRCPQTGLFGAAVGSGEHAAPPGRANIRRGSNPRRAAWQTGLSAPCFGARRGGQGAGGHRQPGRPQDGRVPRGRARLLSGTLSLGSGTAGSVHAPKAALGSSGVHLLAVRMASGHRRQVTKTAESSPHARTGHRGPASLRRDAVKPPISSRFT